HNGTLPTFCVPLWVACARPTPSPPTPRPSSHVDTNQPAGHRSPRSFLAGLLQFLVQVSETNGVPSFSTTQKDPTVGRSQVLASHSGTLRPFCVPLWDEQTHALTKAPHREAPQSPRTPGASQIDASPGKASTREASLKRWAQPRPWPQPWSQPWQQAVAAAAGRCRGSRPSPQPTAVAATAGRCPGSRPSPQPTAVSATAGRCRGSRPSPQPTAVAATAGVAAAGALAPLH